MSLSWLQGSDHARCIPCNDDRRVSRLFSAETSLGTPMLGTLCRTCGSVTIDGGEMQVEADDVFVDHYLQSEAGIDTIVQNLYRVDRGPGTNFLDVGANYGFAVRYARDVLGWNALGVEPSYAGRRGARELGVEILDQYVTAETHLARQFDVILASEVIEHVPDPREFVVAMRAHLAPGGVLIMTTPAAEIVRPATEQWAIQAVGPGGHLFLASAEALHSIVSESGFGSVTVHRDGPTLYVAASIESGRMLDVVSRGPSAEQMAGFFASITADDASPPPLRAAMSVRHYRTLVNMGHDAAADERVMIDTVSAVHGIDLGDPAGLARRISGGEATPILIAPAAFACGMRRVVHRTEWDQAAAYFDLAVLSVDSKRRRFHVFDGDSRIIEQQARAHRVLALVHSDPALASAEWHRLTGAGEVVDVPRWTVRLYVEAAAHGLLSSFAMSLTAVADAIVELGAHESADSAVAAFDASYLLARAAIAHGDRWCATQWASVAEQVLIARAEVCERAWREQATHLVAGLRVEIAQLSAEAIPSLVPMPSPAHEAIVWASDSRREVAGGVSVVMALYNGRRYVAEALESIAAQTHPPLEIIVVDDGSHDDSVALIESLDLSVTVRIVSQGNAGQSAARNTGIRAARGEYIAFLDQDDAWPSTHLATLHETISSLPQAGWVFSDFDLIDEAGRTVVQSYLVHTDVQRERRTLADLVQTDIMALPSASIMRRAALVDVRGFDRRLSGYEDDELALRLFRHGWHIVPQLATSVRYRSHDNNASGSVAFLRSRLVFLQILIAHYSGASAWGAPAAESAIARLLRSSKFEYFAALITADDVTARTIGWAIGRMSAVQPAGRRRDRIGLRLLTRPRLARWALRVSGALPASIRGRLLPPIAEHARHQMVRRAADRDAGFTLANRPKWLVSTAQRTEAA